MNCQREGYRKWQDLVRAYGVLDLQSRLSSLFEQCVQAPLLPEFAALYESLKAACEVL
jgi:hypothetical protein